MITALEGSVASHGSREALCNVGANRQDLRLALEARGPCVRREGERREFSWWCRVHQRTSTDDLQWRLAAQAVSEMCLSLTCWS